MLRFMLPNQTPPPSLLWITDPWSTLDMKKDTTLRLAQETKNLGFQSWWTSSDLVLTAKKKLLRVVPIEHAPNPDFAVDLEASNFSQIHYRVDPPVNESYRKLIADIAARVAPDSPGGEPFTRSPRILNPPALICNQTEKLPPEELLDLAPAHFVLHSEVDSERAFPKVQDWNSFVTKPMNLAQSIGVKKWTRPTSLFRFLEITNQEARTFGYPILVEEFLPGIAAGELRMWFSMGHFIGALKKHPVKGDFRVLVDSGSRIEAHVLSPAEERIAGRIGESLRKQGVALAAIDLIDGRICDYNLTSPGLLVQLEEVHGRNLAKEVIEKLVH
jgi:glutathione synthase/RimK-type ligase-like ATP-grasp enzyme